MNIDAHQHFWIFDPIRDSWIDDSMRKIQRDFLPKDLEITLNENGMNGCIAVQASQSVEETDFLLDLASKYDFIKAVVGWVDLQASDITDQLAVLRNFPKLAGFRHVVQAEPDEGFVLRPEFKRGIKALEEFGFTYDLLVFPNQLPASIELVRQFPGQPFVLDHIAKPYIKGGKINAWKSDIFKLATQQNVHCKISGIITEADWKDWTYEQIIPYLDIIFEAFGANRIMFGSDWPVCLVAGTYPQMKEVIDRYMLEFTKEEKKQVMGENAQSFYKF
jgi:L-fuconolactonase